MNKDYDGSRFQAKARFQGCNAGNVPWRFGINEANHTSPLSCKVLLFGRHSYRNESIGLMPDARRAGM